MKKFGFTLSEALIALAIIGTVAAITLPTISKLKPDETKMKYLQAYDSLSKAMERALEAYYPDPEIAGQGEDGTPKQCSVRHWPLLDNSNVTDEYGSIVLNGKGGKLCRTIGSMFNIIEDSPSCQDTPPTSMPDPSFTTTNGMQWRIYPISTISPIPQTGQECEFNEDSGRYLWVVFVDVSPEKSGSVHCIYDSDTCPNPTRFRFFITADGNITIGDEMGLLYNLTRNNTTRNTSLTPDDNINGITPSSVIEKLLPDLAENGDFGKISDVNKPFSE